MTNNTTPQKSQPARPTRSRLSNGFWLVVSGGMWCQWCGEDIRACDAEALTDGGLQHICTCGHVILELRP
jgi:hypothetical protein